MKLVVKAQCPLLLLSLVLILGTACKSKGSLKVKFILDHNQVDGLSRGSLLRTRIVEIDEESIFQGGTYVSRQTNAGINLPSRFREKYAGIIVESIWDSEGRVLYKDGKGVVELAGWSGQGNSNESLTFTRN